MTESKDCKPGCFKPPRHEDKASWKLTPVFNVTAGARLDAFTFQYADYLDSAYHRQTATATSMSPKLNSPQTYLLNDEWNEGLAGEPSGISELTFTPGDPFFIKTGITFFF
ncbi:MAG TPA: hypothetical protein VIQ51_14160 [Chryseosolibacter sp.]